MPRKRKPPRAARRFDVRWRSQPELITVLGRGHRRRGCRCDSFVLVVATWTTDWTAQKLGLLVGFCRQAIAHRPIAAALRQAAFGTRFARALFRGRLLRALGPFAVHAMFGAVRTIRPVAVGTVKAVLALVTVGAIRAVTAVEPAAFALKRAIPISIAVPVARTLILIPLFAMHSMRAIVEAAFVAAAFVHTRLFAAAVTRKCRLFARTFKRLVALLAG